MFLKMLVTTALKYLLSGLSRLEIRSKVTIEVALRLISYGSLILSSSSLLT